MSTLASTTRGAIVLGIEIGGTKLQLGVGDGTSAQLAELVRVDIDRSAGAAGILRHIASVGATLVERHSVDRIGVGFGGPVDMTTGRVTRSFHVSGWDGFGLGEWCKKEFGLPVSVANDCDASGLGEARHGAGAGHRLVLYVTVGTGIGGGLIVDGEIYAPHRLARTELGHLRAGLGATGTDDIVESMASGLGIAQQARNLADAGGEAVIAALLRAAGIDSLDRLTTKALAGAASEGDPIAREVFDRATRALGWAIAQTISLTAVEVVVMGGGVSLSGEDLFFKPIRRHAETYVYPPLRRTYEVVPACTW